MRSSLVVLAVALASLYLVQTALARRLQHAALMRKGRRRERGNTQRDVTELTLAQGAASGARAAGLRGVGGGRKGAQRGEESSSRSVDWRYYGFSNRGSEADGTVVEPAGVAGSLAIGSIVESLPDDCVSTLVNGCVYLKCGDVWYQPQYTGSDVTYLVISAP